MTPEIPQPTPEPRDVADASSAARSDPPSPAAPPRRGITLAHLVMVAGAVVGGAALTVLAMGARPSAYDPVTVSAVPTGEPAAPRPAVPAIDPGAPPKWSTAKVARWLSHPRRDVAFELAAERPIAVWTKSVTPLLVVRCMNRRTDVFVFTDSPARIEAEDEDHSVRLWLDDDPPAAERWPDSIEHDALFAPDGEALARRLTKAQRLTFAFSPHNAAPVAITFDVRGLAERLSPVAGRCGWRPDR